VQKYDASIFRVESGGTCFSEMFVSGLLVSGIVLRDEFNVEVRDSLRVVFVRNQLSQLNGATTSAVTVTLDASTNPRRGFQTLASAKESRVL
jgi:hypothetical protein